MATSLIFKTFNKDGHKRKLSGCTPQLPHCYPTVTPQVEKVLSAIGQHSLSTKEIMGIIDLKDKSNFLELYLYPAIRHNLVESIYPENPNPPTTKIPSYEQRESLAEINLFGSKKRISLTSPLPVARF